MNFQERLAEFWKQEIERHLLETRGDQSKAARLMGIHRGTLRNKMRDLGMRK